MAKRFYAVCSIDIVDEDGVPVHSIEDQTYPMELTSSDVDPVTLREINRYEIRYVFMNMEEPYRPRPSFDDFMEDDACFAMERDSVRMCEFSMEQIEWIRNRLCEHAFATDTGLLRAFNAQFNCDRTIPQLQSCILDNHLAALAFDDYWGNNLDKQQVRNEFGLVHGAPYLGN